MKCEICHQSDAATAIVVHKDGEEQELYVCRECANKERVRRQKKSQRTRKAMGLPPGVSMSISRISGDVDPEDPPPFIKALIDAVGGVLSDAEKEARGKKKQSKSHDFPCSRVEEAYRIGDALHLEGLHLIGELEPAMRAMHALDMELVGREADGIRDAGHVYKVRYSCAPETAKRVVSDLLREERNARVRLVEEMPRVLGDSLCRALAVLKNCRLLSQGEFFDLLSPMRLAAMEGMLDGLDLAGVSEMLAGIDLDQTDEELSQQDRDRADAERADQVNARFEDVVLNERAEGGEE